VLEIIALVLIGKNIAGIAKKKNRSPTGYVLLLVFSWFGCEITGAIAGVIVAEIAQVGDGPDMLIAIGGALVGVAIAVCVSYAVVNAAVPLPRRPSDYDDYDDEPRPRRRRYEDDDEDDRPRARRDRDDRYEDDRPRRRYEDDDRPRRRRSSGDADDE
jgi:hypothetical protein